MRWRDRLSSRMVFVAEHDAELVGFTTFEAERTSRPSLRSLPIPKTGSCHGVTPTRRARSALQRDQAHLRRSQHHRAPVLRTSRISDDRSTNRRARERVIHQLPHGEVTALRREFTQRTSQAAAQLSPLPARSTRPARELLAIGMLAEETISKCQRIWTSLRRTHQTLRQADGFQKPSDANLRVGQ